MVKRKHVATKKTGYGSQPEYRAGSSKGPTTSSGKRPVVEPNEEVERKKREREEEERIEKDAWVSKMKSRVFTCERQVNQTKLGKHPVVEAIERQGLTFFFKPMKRFKKETVKTFYENMVVDRDEEVIVSQVGRVIVQVTPDSIAHYLSYKRPTSTNYPRGERRRQGTTVKSWLCLGRRTRELIGHCGYGRRWGNLEERAPANGNVPFPVMITKMCESARCKPTSGDGLMRATPGPIHGGTVKKSASASKAPRVKTLADSLPTSTNHHERNEEWHSINHARQQVLMDNQCKLETNQRRMKRGIDKIKKLVQWLVTCEGERRGQAYEDPDREEDSGSELEVLHDFERSDTEEEEYVEEGDDDDDA
ncbi:hypothetical protein Vadar_008152 [Vaccinium darrowii]|uniref:Uncharacterized protein n=1 Tax=Vaccinium darrowii TaxID=229202 RepID=A0ACB7YKD6_9ERIC|nr:hypothetical protein Vadar_008152 [Vaccinium darrowii]